MQGDLQEDEIFSLVEDVMVNLVELPKNPRVVGCRNLQESGRHFEELERKG